MDVKVLIEIPEGSAIKYEQDEDTGEITIDRVMPTAMRFPFSYGAIQNTHGEDGDALDALVFISQPVVPNVIVKCQVIGMLEMEDEGGIDHKMVCVPLPKVDFICGQWHSLADVPKHRLDQIRHFFEHYKDFEEGKWVKLKEWKDAATAEKVVAAAQQRSK